MSNLNMTILAFIILKLRHVDFSYDFQIGMMVPDIVRQNVESVATLYVQFKTC